jgi:mannose-6-phosphate isomerase-like protein (cupin superfamily)
MSYQTDILKATEANTYFRRVLFTTPLSQLVVMCVQPGEDIGLETHDLDQVLFFVSGEGESFLNGHKGTVGSGTVVVVPAGTEHNFVNTGEQPLKLYTVYTPPEHADGTIHKTKAEAEADEHDHAPAVRGGIQAPRGFTVGSLLGK